VTLELPVVTGNGYVNIAHRCYGLCSDGRS
jgi:hypothetical protein